MTKRILALDLDGVIFQFNDPYAAKFESMFGLKFPPETPDFPNVWDWERAGGATSYQINKVWKEINEKESYNFWRNLPPYDGAKKFLAQAQGYFDEVHFITSRTGTQCQQATEDALKELGAENPNVIIAGYKVPALVEIGATDFLDDRDKNFEDILKAGQGGNYQSLGQLKNLNLWMLDRPWNRKFSHSRVVRVNSPMEILKCQNSL